MRLKKVAAALLTAAMLASSQIPTSFAEISVTPVIETTFEDGNGYTLQEGSILVNSRGGNVLFTNGAGQYADINDVSALNSIEGDFSISVWFYPQNKNMWSRVYDIGTGMDQYIFLTPASSFTGKPRFCVKYNNIEQILDSSRACAIGQWNNITVTCENGTTKLYLNGVLSGQTDSITYNFKDIGATDKNYLGKSMYPADPYFCGMIDDFSVYNTALGANEIKTMVNEVYDREMQSIKEDNIINKNYLDIDTHFYDAESGEKIFAFGQEQSVEAVTKVKNYKENSTELTVTSYNDKAKENEVKVTLESGEEYTYSRTFSGKDISEYSVEVSDSVDEMLYNAGMIMKNETVVFPEKSPVDSDATTTGAHDPSIFKDPVSGEYYAYSSHNQIFKSTDLINWTKYKVEITVPDKCKEFIENNYPDTTVNGTYWAPDVVYVPEDTEHPYWMYVSVSCGLGARNSVIGLVKSDKPGFWVDGEVTDCGVVIASKEEAGYRTNAIDANIYTDSDGKKYFVWGSFWEGVHMALLKDDGTIAGVDYTSDATILSTSKTAGTRVYSTPNGIVGPEGPWLIDNSDENYRYMFTSYGWLGSNYNLRVARADMSKTIETSMNEGNLSTTFKDYNDNLVSTAYSQQTDYSTLWGYKIIGSYQLGDGIKYVGQGHNSVIKDDDGSWYLVEHCRKVAESVAYLQVRKMLWTEDGWPVVSPLVYAGEKEQVIPEEMLLGTWDLSSVGHTIWKDGVNAISGEAHGNSDLPVLSSEIVIAKDNKLGNGLGSWEYDGDHTITITFEKDGNESDYEFYKSGDKMKLFVLTGYDKDKRESALVMTGIDQNGITQFAKKNNASADAALVHELEAAESTVSVTIPKSIGGNPALGFDGNGNILYGGDPAALVDGDTVYIYAGHDIADKEEYVMSEYVAYSSKDMKNWQYHGSVMKASDVSWRNVENAAWASQAVKYNDKYYLYFCTWDKTSEGKQSIGVAVSDSPTGPFKDIGKPLVQGTVTAPETSGWNDIDPTVWIETVDGVEHRYLGWGNGIYYICELNEDMISVKDVNSDGKIDMEDIHQQSFTNIDGHGFTEAPWIYRRKDADGNYYGKYYTFFASDWREQMSYAVSDDISSNTWEYKGVIMPPSATSNTNHPSVIDFNGKTYFIYHNGMLSNGSGFRRSVCIEEMTFDEEGNVMPVKETSTGLTGTAFEIKCGERLLNYNDFTNSSADVDYPISKKVNFAFTGSCDNAKWEIVAGKADTKEDTYVSIQAVHKPGLYLSVNDKNEVIMTQDTDGKQAEKMTFKTVKGIYTGKGISLESVAKPGYYVTSAGDELVLTNGGYEEACEFEIEELSDGAEETKFNMVSSVYDEADKTLTIGFSLVNLSGTYTEPVIIAGVYNKDGSLKKTEILNEITIENDGSANGEIVVDNLEMEDGDYLNLFAWEDISSQEPICKKVYKEID